MQSSNVSFRRIQNVSQTIRVAIVGYWRVPVAIVLSLMMLGGTIVLVDVPAVGREFFCAPNESMLVYPLYDRRGNIVDTRSLCGVPHRGCTRKFEESQVFDCSPFMAPEELWAVGGALYN